MTRGWLTRGLVSGRFRAPLCDQFVDEVPIGGDVREYPAQQLGGLAAPRT